MSLVLTAWDAEAQAPLDLAPADLRYSVPGTDGGPPLVTVVVQHAHTGAMLMTAFADRVAVERTVATGYAWFWSRSRGRLWQKGETSGHLLEVLSARVDCDADALLLQVLPAGPACHRGTVSCFMPSSPGLELGWLYEVLRSRAASGEEGSYTARLLARGVPRVAQKVGEEAVETVIAALEGALDGTPRPEAHEATHEATRDATREAAREELVKEASDLVYHLLVLLLARGVDPSDLARELGRRHALRTEAGGKETP